MAHPARVSRALVASMLALTPAAQAEAGRYRRKSSSLLRLVDGTLEPVGDNSRLRPLRPVQTVIVPRLPEGAV